MNKILATLGVVLTVSFVSAGCGGAPSGKCAGVSCSAGEECKADTGKCGPLGSGGSGGGSSDGGGGTGGGSGGSGGGFGANEPLDMFAGDLSKALCSYLESCGYLDSAQKPLCTEAFSTGNPLTTLPTGFSKNPAAVVRKAQAGSLGYDSAQAAKCLAAFPTYGCAGFTYLSSTVLPSECLGVFKSGVVGAGGKCSASTDCDAGACTLVNGCGTCSGAKAQGEACTSSTQCPTGLRCIGNGPDAGSTCDAPRPPSSLCLAFADCDATLGYCPGYAPTDGGLRRCVGLGAVGDSCEWQASSGVDNYADGNCNYGLFCDAADAGFRGCTPQRAPGAACLNSYECNRDAGYSCRSADAGAGVPLSRTCATIFADGAPCLSSLDCASGSCPSVTDGGTRVCTPKTVDGQPCTTSTNCATPLCNNGSPAPLGTPRTCGYLPLGTACYYSGDCSPGNFCKGYLNAITGSPAVAGQCAPLSPDGGACTDEIRTHDSCANLAETCIGGFCKTVNAFSLPVGSECDSATQCGGKSYCKITDARLRKGTCTPWLSVGEGCISNDECGGACVGSPRVCAARLSENEVCISGSNPTCKVGLRCGFDAGSYACRPLSGLGGNCTSSSHCYAGYCGFDAGTSACTDFSSGGQVVGSTTSCASGLSVLDAGIRTCVDVCF